ncbi:hypothetical protein R1sor_012818 [Riccia sorocarpa]|uniref:Fibronectin type III-like domain-containing protein n=1 Tax=Riccia sorocarpa TaxID=122646 RepID=A0ABD3I8V6_9MARC
MWRYFFGCKAIWRQLAVLLVLFQLSWTGEYYRAQGAAFHGCSLDLDPSIWSLPFCNTTLPIWVRTLDLVSQLTLAEKIGQLVNTAPAIPRLGIPSHEWWNEALHGLAYSPGVTFTGPAYAATSFPQPILTAASFNTTLWTLIGQAISTEARAMYNLGQSHLTFWAPNINIFRDPRWGRGQETPGEDPLLTSRYAAAFVRGMQEIDYFEERNTYKGPDGGKHFFTHDQTSRSDSENHEVRSMHRLKTSVCCKHFTAYDMENSDGLDRFHFNAQVCKQDLEDTYNRPFQSCVEEGRATCLMCSYNQVNGIPACADYYLLTELARNRWGLDGYITSDCNAVELIYSAFNYTQTEEDAVTAVLDAGLDLNCGTTTADWGLSAIHQGKLSESTVDRAVFDLFSVRFRLGQFDGDLQYQLYGSLGLDNICSDEHKELAIEAARQGIVLLKNQDNILPFLQGDIQSIALVGHNINATEAMLGNYHGSPCEYITPLQGLQSYTSVVFYEPGCLDILCQDVSIAAAAVTAISYADAIVIMVGLDQTQEGEALDRASLLLPWNQQILVETVANYAEVPTVLVIMSGGAVDLTFAKDNPNIHGILWIGYPGQGGGQALADILFGHHNPGGRLPVTWYPESLTQVPMTEMRMRPNTSSGYPGRTYRFYTGEPVYEFGYGLSYTQFVCTNLYGPDKVLIPSRRLQQCYHNRRASEDCLKGPDDDVTCDNTVFQLQVSVTNQGVRRGSAAILLYWVPTDSGVDGEPLKQLIDFQRVLLDAYTSAVVSFLVSPCDHLISVLHDGSKLLHEGIHSLVVESTFKNELVHSLSLIVG